MEHGGRVGAINRKEQGDGVRVVVGHLNQLGIVAEVRREIGVAEWLSAPHRLVLRLLGPIEENCYVVSYWIGLDCWSSMLAAD